MEPNYHLFHLNGFKKKKLAIWADKITFQVLTNFKGLLSQVDYILIPDKEYWGQKIINASVVDPTFFFSKYKFKNQKVAIMTLAAEHWKPIQNFAAKYGIYNVFPANLFQFLSPYAKQLEEIMLAQNPILNRENKKQNQAIIVRGWFDPFFTPILIKQLKLYFPKNPVILSTWKNTSKELLENLDIEEIILNEEPEIAGQAHRNFQIATVVPALKCAKKLGYEEVFIQRTDQMFFNKDLLTNCSQTINLYPVNIQGLNKRILVSDKYFRKNIPYHPSDMFMYGNIDDLLKFWDHELDIRKDKPIGLQDIITKRNVSVADLISFSKDSSYPEVYFFKNMLKKLNHILLYTIEDWHLMASQIFIIKNVKWWDFFWYKPDKVDRNAQILDEGYPLECISEQEWERLQRDTKIQN